MMADGDEPIDFSNEQLRRQAPEKMDYLTGINDGEESAEKRFLSAMLEAGLDLQIMRRVLEVYEASKDAGNSNKPA
jgi:hypothetical protein